MYKKELCAIVEFARKYEHMLRSPSPSVILTDHKPLIYFLVSSMLDGIYARWASELRCLGVEIVWIPGSRNVVADALSRTVFPDAECNTPPMEEFGELVLDGHDNPLWVWKDGKGGYEELLKKVAEPLRIREIENLTKYDTSQQWFRTIFGNQFIEIGDVGKTKLQIMSGTAGLELTDMIDLNLVGILNEKVAERMNAPR
ncbi:hypothetical protein K3495_g7728 [Podosphaera aphanis]|nr:hypothetical protein K3495_g7728 [Podosphaera aphanis]